MFEGKKILITGGGGFIGSFLLNQLSVNHKLISIDHGSRYKILEKKLSENVKGVEFYGAVSPNEIYKAFSIFRK